MDKKLKSVLKQSFTPPPTQHREQFINSIAYPKACVREVFFAQIMYIRTRVWIFFMLIIGIAFFYTQFAKVSEHIVAGVSALLPFFSLCAVTEIYKSTAYNMEEMELACKNNLSKITLMRIGILGTVSFILLVLLGVIVGNNDYGVFRNSIYLGVPYLLSAYISLLIIAKFRAKETVYVCAVISGAVSICMMIVRSSYSFIYNFDFTAIWVIAFILFAVLLFYSLIRFTKSREELQWNLL